MPLSSSVVVVVVACAMVVTAAILARVRRAALPFVFRAGAALMTLVVALAAFTAPLWVIITVAVVGTGFIIGDALFAHSADERIHKRLDALEVHDKIALVERLHQLQSDVQCLTKPFYIRQSELRAANDSDEYGLRRSGELLNIQQEAVVKFVEDYETAMLFIIHNLRRYGFAPDDDFDRIIASGASTAEDLDNIAAGLHRMIMAVNSREW